MAGNAESPLMVEIWMAEASPELAQEWEGALPVDLRSTLGSLGPTEKQREVVRQALRRSVLAQRSGVAITDLELPHEPGGAIKPPDGLWVSAAHHDDATAFAVAAGGSGLGVDLEPTYEHEWEAALGMVLTDREQAALASLKAEERPTAYFTCWTLKEAVMKALGDGLSDRDMRSICVTFPPGQPNLISLGEEKPIDAWGLWSAVLREHVYSVAVRGVAQIAIRVREWPLDLPNQSC